MAASIKTHASELEVEIVVGSYEQVLFGYSLTNKEDEALLKLSFTDKSHAASVRALAISSSKLLASGSADETIQLFDLKTRQEAGTLMKHNGTITAIEFCDEFMFSSDDVGTICIWKVRGKSFECLKTLSGHKGSVLSMSVHPTGKLLLSVGHDKTIRTWNLVTAKRAYTTSTPAMVDIVKWTPDGTCYILCYNSKLDICSVSSAATIHSVKLPGKAHAIDFIDSKTVVAGCEGGQVVFVDIENGTISHDFTVKGNRVKCLNVKVLEPQKCLLALTSNDGLIELHLIEVKKKKIVNSLVAATKTVLRPVCMDLSVQTEEDSPAKEQTADSGEEGQRSAVHKKGNAARKRASVDHGQAKPGKQSKVIHKAEDDKTEDNMDTFKKILKPSKADKGEEKDSEDDNKRKTNKKHMRPVDSVKMTKQKMAEKKKQHHAKHHHIVEETEST